RLHPLIELSGKTLGLIGFGRIGRAVAPIARALGMHVLVTTRTTPSAEHASDIDREVIYVNLEELLSASDIISLHCPLTPQTENLINEKTIALAKDGFMLINTGRGPLIDEQALAQALTTGKAGGAALDVLSTEPPAADNPLLTAPNCIITPHIAWAPKQTRERLMNIAAGNLAAWLSEEEINTVN
ncbi:MAG: NAD(P)-binding domain-containing protein, partial [Clostridiaceae bacterium]|nr:NAD(P)-binding domain-containing protein [Clostridiaceae bacterium]